MNKKSIWIFLLFLSSCHKHSQRKIQQASGSIELEACFFDIPIFIKPLSLHQENNFLSYKVHAQLQEVAHYYQQELELFGWDQAYHFAHEGSLFLIYTKPPQQILISLKTHALVTSVEIYQNELAL